MTGSPAQAGGSRLIFVIAILTGSFLLFLVQPMIARMALPRLGGAPAVWNSAMLVYQALLLGGYAYAHAIGRLPLKGQAAVHVALLLVAGLMLPISLVAATPSPDANPFLWTPWLLVVSIGPLFFAVAAQAPLLQRWFAASGDGDPYPLYAASNLGSFGGLIVYPLLIEPFLPVRAQSWLWSAGYGVLILLVVACALVLRRGTPEEPVATERTRLTVPVVLHWIALAAIPSGLLLSTTTHLTTDIVTVPLLWVVPLGLYLLSFTVAFAADRRLARGIGSIAALVMLIGGGVAFAENPSYPWVFAPLGLITLFVISVALHSMMYDRRPDPSRLTAFYLAMSFGGVLGGLFCALIAPLVFDWGYEHPILILAAAALLMPQRPLFGFTARLWRDPGRKPIIIGLLALLASMAAGGLFGFIPDPVPQGVKLVAILIVINLAIASLGNRAAYTLSLAALMLTLDGRKDIKTSLIHQARVRSYFGIYSVGNGPGPSRQLVHGTTIHGIQNLQPGHERDTLSYYAPRSGVGLAMRQLAVAVPHARIGIVGLGSGTLACYARPGQDWRFYEIDPAMVAIARDPHRFTFLSRCTPGVPIKLGDARLTLAREPAGGLDMLVIDAFSSDAVPMHLLTREAFEVYGRRLTANGMLLVHISNRFIDLEPVVAAEASAGWHLAVRDYAPTQNESRRGMAESLWIAMSRDPGRVARLVSASGSDSWRAAKPRANFTPWTDDHGSILPLIHFRRPQ